VKHRSPLITLAAVAVAFAIMFIVNMSVSPPRGSSTGTATPPPAPAPAASTGPSAQVTETTTASTSASPTKSVEESKFPNKIVYAGHAEDGGAIAVAVLGTRAAAYFCDGHSVESWFKGAVQGGDISLKSKDGGTLQASLDGDHLKGLLRIKSQRMRFEINEAKKPAGIYRARGSKTTIGWIVLEDGSEVGVQTTSQNSTAAPELDPDDPQVTVDGKKLDAAPINGDEDL
jgi:hypothetical protein